MLQFNSTIYMLTTRVSSRLWWRFNASLTTNTATVVSESVNNNVKHDNQSKGTTTNMHLHNEQCIAFNELKSSLCSGLQIEPAITTKIQNAENVHDLLELIKVPLLSETDIRKAIETIALWVSKNQKNESSQKDNNVVKNQMHKEGQQAKKLNSDEVDYTKYSDFSTAEMIKEINRLSQTGNRNTQLLNYLFNNIIEYNKELHPGACSSLMYSMSNLSYSDERLLRKICEDLINNMNRTKNAIPAVTLLSIVKSMAIVRYRNNEFLNHVCCDIIEFKNKYKHKQLTSILLSLASLGYHSEYVDKIIEHSVPTFSMKILGHVNWLNLIWSLVVYNKADAAHVASVLSEDFVNKLMFFDPKRKLSYQLKLLNINGYAHYALNNYNGPSLGPDVVPPVVCKRSKQKELYVNALEATLKNMLPSASHYKMNIDTQMGFLLDAVLYMDSEFKLRQINNGENEQFNKVGIMLVDYYDMCLGDTDYHGLIKLYTHLLTCQKYEVLCISYQHFGIEDKIEKRVSYLRRQLWKKFKQSF